MESYTNQPRHFCLIQTLLATYTTLIFKTLSLTLGITTIWEELCNLWDLRGIMQGIWFILLDN
ncbi:wsv385 [White spot syndrome virus]|uniref:Wsv385 n=4 Tax=White spot syndrome virus TaxID=342409 RepID=Q8VAL6_WSSVS|nr:wsv385 [Shrimp white spot syndrome virus]AFX59762.1 wsv385 [White spot syndrome virus]AAL33387.1 wsv385 [Shrimp white spot syndrome virus]AAL89312.1 WSSV444 [Shrimp white spot syndrome virus]AWQ61374.1 wsv385 [Shrimp white spot syndrome virus]AWQ62228.1 wsv385 [Shrimp white spot syndrome virus]